MECKTSLRLRGGEVRQLHFFHLESKRGCFLNQKSLKHLQVQRRLQALCSKEDTVLEMVFPEIKRIADVVWKSKKIVFEVQCSPISVEEVLKRTEDYRSLGYEIVWIFHDDRYNRIFMTPVEKFIQKQTHYYTNIDRNGCGYIYDQFSFSFGRIRSYGSPVYPIDITAPFLNNSEDFRKTWILYFKNDLLFQGINFLKDESKAALQLGITFQKIKNFYFSLFKYFFEKMCK